MTTIDPALLDEIATLSHQVDAAQQALLDANNALEAAANAAEPAWQACFEALCRAGDEYDNVQMDLAEAMREALDGPIAEDDDG